MSGDADVSRTAAQTTHDDGIPGSEPGIIDLMDPGQDEGTPSLPPRLDSQPALHEPESTPQHAIQDEDEHPQVALLRAMFPDFDGAVLLSVLESVDYDQDRAIDALLGMSDPEYVSTQGQAPPPHDVSLDEQLARQLALEDQPEPRHASGQAWPRRNSVPYQPRQSAPSHNQQAQNVTGSERGDFQEFQETIGRMAESGKKTFSSIMSKAKAKINEYNQQYNQRSGQPSSVDNSNNSQWDSTSRPQLDRHTTSQAYAQQYYNYGSSDNLESPSDDTHPPITLNGKQPSVSGRDEVKGYDIEPSK
ncbi:uncharacterized protein FIBRA_05329 [Fibroporia radiculosa]|uniref:CUE domain-containing protein n=1 Tax=Fibroporia radiculosa TaxID=599839 RepID=J4GQS9_9APHY|nr:uncharacterized protein FIBRA_05329 [Fibroporia radiculosa]CCM03205.1 predicted protein [Fibroporia radiculosa]